MCYTRFHYFEQKIYASSLQVDAKCTYLHSESLSCMYFLIPFYCKIKVMSSTASSYLYIFVVINRVLHFTRFSQGRKCTSFEMKNSGLLLVVFITEILPSDSCLGTCYNCVYRSL